MTYRDTPGTETATCAAPDCQAEFTKRPGAKHQIYCSKKCRNQVAKVLGAQREAMVPKGAKKLRKICDELGGTDTEGGMLSGTAIIGRRAAIDVRETPADDPRFW